MVASLVRLAAAWDDRVNMSGQRYCDRSVWEMWRKWDEAEWGLHVQGPQGSTRIRAARDWAIV